MDQFFKVVYQPRNLAVLVVITAILLGGIFYYNQLIFALSGYTIPDFERGHSLDELTARFRAFGDAGIALYRRVELLDIIYPLFSTMIIAALLYRLLGGFWFVLPYSCLFADYFENFGFWILIGQLPNLDPDWVRVVSLASWVKASTFVLSLGHVIVAYFYRRRAA